MNTFGRRVESYRLLEKIGEGGMGVVYRAVDETLARTVAIKVMNPREASKPDFKQRFLREARAASSLNHPNIAQVFRMFEHEGTSYIVMEHLDGPTLQARLKKEGTISFSEAASITKQVAEALRAAHAAGLVHRDIKPANIGFDSEGRVKLLDFGLAKWYERGKAGDSFETATAEMVMGTVAYMSPEVALTEPVDARTDFFSLGVMLYEMVTGEMPFKGRDNIGLLYEITRGQAVPPESLGVPPDLATVISRMLEKKPIDRYQSASQLLADLEKVHLSLMTGRIRLRRRWLKRSQILRAVGIAALVAAVGGTAVFLLTYTPRVLRREAAAPVSVPSVTVLPVVNRTGDDSVSKLSLPLTHLLTAEMRPLRSIDILDFDRLIAVPGVFGTADAPDPALYARLRQVRPTSVVVRPVLFRIGRTWQAVIEFRDPRDGSLLDTRTCRQDVGDDPEGSLGPLLDRTAREIVGKLGGSAGEMTSPAVPLPPRRLESQAHFARGIELSQRQEHLAAREAFMKALRIEPVDPMTMLRLSQEARALGYQDEAARYARQASSLINESMNIAQGYEIDAQLAEVMYTYDRAREILQKLIALYPRRPEYYVRLGEVELQAGFARKAEANWREALHLSPSDTPALLALAARCVQQGRHDEGAALYDRASKIYDGTGNQEGRAAVLRGLAEIDYRRNRISDGRRKYEAALAIYRSQENPYGIAMCTSGIGIGQQILGDYAGSRERLAESRQMFAQLGNVKELIEQELQWTRLLLETGDYQGALRIGQEAEKRAEQNGNPLLIALCSASIGRVMGYLGQYPEAERRIGGAVDEFRRLSAKSEEGRALGDLAGFAYESGEFDTCIALCGQGVKLAREISDSDLENQLLATESEVAYFRADYARALDVREQGAKLFRSVGDENNLAYAAYNIARIQLALGLFADGERSLAEAEAFFRKSGSKKMLGLALLCRLHLAGESPGSDRIPPERQAAGVAQNLEDCDNPAYRLLGRAYRDLYSGTDAEQDRDIASIAEFLQTRTVDVLVRQDLQYALGDLCIRRKNWRAGIGVAADMIRTARRLAMPEYGARGCLLAVRCAAGDPKKTLQQEAQDLGRRWYRELTLKMPADRRDAFGKRATIADLAAAFGKQP